MRVHLTVKDVTARRSGYHLNPEPIPLQQPSYSIVEDVRKTFRTVANRWTLEEHTPDDGRLTGTVTRFVFGFIDDFEDWLESVNPGPEVWKVSFVPNPASIVGLPETLSVPPDPTTNN